MKCGGNFCIVVCYFMSAENLLPTYYCLNFDGMQIYGINDHLLLWFAAAFLLLLSSVNKQETLLIQLHFAHKHTRYKF